MTRDEADAEVRRLTAVEPAESRNRFVARERDGEFEVVRVPIPPGIRVAPLKTAIEERPKPPYPEDARSPHERNVPGLPGGLA